MKDFIDTDKNDCDPFHFMDMRHHYILTQDLTAKDFYFAEFSTLLEENLATVDPCLFNSLTLPVEGNVSDWGICAFNTDGIPVLHRDVVHCVVCRWEPPGGTAAEEPVYDEATRYTLSLSREFVAWDKKHEK